MKRGGEVAVSYQTVKDRNGVSEGDGPYVGEASPKRRDSRKDGTFENWKDKTGTG